MKQQVVVIHGGDSYATYDEFITNLVKTAVSLEWLAFKGWKSDLADVLGEAYEIIKPSMPNPLYAHYREWKIWFEKYLPFLQPDVILIGHSLGGSFLAKYLSEESFPVSVKATFLVAPPFDQDGDRTLVEFDQTTSLDGLRAQGGKLFLYHSADDDIVPVAEQEKYEALLPQATVRRFTDRGHFNQAEFPELVADIRAVDNPDGGVA